MGKIKVVHVEDRFHPQMGYQLNFTAKFHRREFEMHIVCADSLRLWNQNASLTREMVSQMDKDFQEEYGIFIHRLPVRYEKSNGYNLLMKGVVKKIYELKPDVLFVHAMESYTAFSLLRRASLYTDFLVCCDTHTLYNQFTNTLVERIYFALFKHFVIRMLIKKQAPVFYTASENKEILTLKYGLPDIQVYPYLIGTDSLLFFPDKAAGSALKRQLHIPEVNHIVLYAGKFNAAKQPHLLLEALAMRPEKLSNLTVVMVGGKQADYYQEYFSFPPDNLQYQLIILDAVTVSELNEYYNMADLLVFPKENTLSALDAQLSGTPVVMEADLTNQERLQKGGLCYASGMLSDLNAKIHQLLSDDALRMKLGEEGRQFIADQYAYKNIVHNMEEVLIKAKNR